MILKVHPSNYRIEGFHEEVSVAELSVLAHEHGLLLYEDQGSGALLADGVLADAGEQPTSASLCAGVDVVSCSGDKLLGASQAGIILGSAQVIAVCASHPLMRALRPGKLTLAALEATLRLYVTGPDTAQREIPVLNMLSGAPAPLERQAKRCMTACCASFASLSVRRRWSCRLSRACLLRAAVRCDRRAPNFLRCRLSRRWASIRRWPKARYGTGARYAGCDARAARPGAF